MRKCLSYILGGLAVFLAACNSTNHRLSESPSDTPVAFSKAYLVPPPRISSDLWSLLPQPEVPPTLDLAPGCGGRSVDGRWNRLVDENLEVYGPNERIVESIHPDGNWDIKWGWELYRVKTIASLRRGDLNTALEANQNYIANIPENRKGAKITAYSRLAMINVARGDLDAAKAALDTAQDWSDRAQRRPREKVLNHDAWLTRARGDLSAGRGAYDQAAKYYRESIAKKSSVRPHSAEIGLTRSRLAIVLADQGKNLEAETEARQALAHAIEHSRADRGSNGSISGRLARVLHDQGRLKEAERFAISSIAVFQSRCVSADSIEFANARRTLGEVIAEQGRFAEALDLYEAIEAAMGRDNPVLEAQFGGDLTWAYALTRVGREDEARQRLDAAVIKLQDTHGATHPRTAEALGFLAISEAASGDIESAEQHFSRSLDVLRDPKKRVGVRPHNLRLIFESWMALQAAQPDKDPEAVDKMFMLAEVLRGSSVQVAVTAMGVRAAAGKPELAMLLRSEQDARHQLKAMEATFNNALVSGVDSRDLKRNVLRLRDHHASLLERIEVRFPDYSDLMQSRPIGLSEVQDMLRAGETFIATYSAEEHTYLWTVTKTGGPRFQKANIGKKALQAEVGALRVAFEPRGNTLAGIPDFDLRRAYNLYERLFRPVEDAWSNSGTLIVVAHGPLGYLPLSILPVTPAESRGNGKLIFSKYRDVDWWVRRQAITYIPSAGSLKTFRTIPSGNVERNLLMAFGDPVFSRQQAVRRTEDRTQPRGLVPRTRGLDFRQSPVARGLGLQGPSSVSIENLPRLPETANELKNIARALNVSESDGLRLGLDANELVVKSTGLDAYRIIVFATHGLIPGDLDGLRQPALALTAPELAGVDGDGLLTMDEIMALELQADWVVLSACNTGAGEGEGAEAVSGLGQAFFYAGARTLLVSNWSVESSSAALLTTGIFSENRAVESKALALQRSMKTLIDEGEFHNAEGEPVYSYAHPIFWAPFTLVGDGVSRMF